MFVNRSGAQLSDKGGTISYNADIVLQNEVSKETQSTQGNSSKDKKCIPMICKNRTATSSPYDNLFLDGTSSKLQLTPINNNDDNSIFVENQKNSNLKKRHIMGYQMPFNILLPLRLILS